MQKCKIFIIALFAMSCFLYITSCGDNDSISDDDVNISEGESVPPTKELPITDWGVSKATVISRQGKPFYLINSNDNELKYANDDRGIIIDYCFTDDKLIGACLTQAKISKTYDVIKTWLKGYKQISKSPHTLLYAKDDDSTLAYGKIIKGSNCNYASMAWTYIDANEDENNGPDYSPSGQIDNYDYVDLGIGLGWAIQNLGASSPEKSGGYYLWGETNSRYNCWWWYYDLYRGDINNYLDEDKFYTPYSDISGTKYDAVHKKMGGGWRMPSRADLYSLINNCEMEPGTYKGVQGFIVTGPSGKSIFLPALGYKRKEEVYDGTVKLWSSSASGKMDAYILDYMPRNLKDSGIKTEARYCGLPIRGVINLE